MTAIDKRLEATPHLIPTSALGLFAAVAGAWYAMAAVLMHVIQPELHPLHTFMSQYVLGRGGWLMTTTFFAWGLGMVAVILALGRTLNLQRSGKVGRVFVWIGAIGIAGAGVFTSDPGHAVFGFFGLLAMGLGLILTSLEFRRHAGWSDVAVGLLVLAILNLAGYLAIVFVIGDGPGAGLAQRIGIGAGLAWMIWVGWRVVGRAS